MHPCCFSGPPASPPWRGSSPAATRAGGWRWASPPAWRCSPNTPPSCSSPRCSSGCSPHPRAAPRCVPPGRGAPCCSPGSSSRRTSPGTPPTIGPVSSNKAAASSFFPPPNRPGTGLLSPVFPSHISPPSHPWQASFPAPCNSSANSGPGNWHCSRRSSSSLWPAACGSYGCRPLRPRRCWFGSPSSPAWCFWNTCSRTACRPTGSPCSTPPPASPPRRCRWQPCAAGSNPLWPPGFSSPPSPTPRRSRIFCLCRRAATLPPFN